jgi:hypothetical protein
VKMSSTELTASKQWEECGKNLLAGCHAMSKDEPGANFTEMIGLFKKEEGKKMVHSLDMLWEACEKKKAEESYCSHESIDNPTR